MTAFINGTDFAEYGVRVLAGSQHDALPETRDRTITIPGMHGALDFGADLNPRLFELKCGLTNATDPANLQAKLRALVAELTDQFGRPKTFELSFSEEPEKHYKARLTNRVAVDRIHRLGFFSLALTAYDPAAYASLTAYDPTEAQPYDSGLVYNDYNADAITMDSGAVTMDSSLTFESGQAGALYYPNPDTLEWKFRRQYYGCHNYSLYNTRLVLTIEGKVSNPKITNQTTGEALAIGVQLGANGRLTVDGYEETIDHPTATYEGDYIDLVPGHNSLLFEGLSPDATVRFDWKHKFV
jgi:hypothetical protein